jgi:hypothetical protein
MPKDHRQPERRKGPRSSQRVKVKDHLQQFHEFALARLGNGGSGLSIDELFEEWRATHPLTEEHRANCKAVAASLRDFAIGFGT